MPTALVERKRPGATGAPRSAAARAAAPALLGYLGARTLGVLVVVAWGAHRGISGPYRLATLWDAAWYQQIAVHGYAGTAPVPGPHGPYQAYAFFPLYPVLIHAIGWLLPVNYAALSVAWLAALAAAWGIFAVAARLYGQRVGVVAAVLWGITPYAVVESAAYSEALFTALAAWSIHSVLRRRWGWAGTLCLLAGLTRPTGIGLAAAVSVAALRELVHRREGWAGVLLAPLGSLGYFGWVGLVKGRWDGYLRVQDAWQSRFDFGHSTVHALKDLISVVDIWLADAVVAGVLGVSVLLLGISFVQRQPLVLLVYSAASLVLALGDTAYFDSRARFLLPAFGLLLPVAAGLARLRSRASVAIVLMTAAVASAGYGGYVLFVFPDAP